MWRNLLCLNENNTVKDAPASSASQTINLLAPRSAPNVVEPPPAPSPPSLAVSPPSTQNTLDVEHLGNRSDSPQALMDHPEDGHEAGATILTGSPTTDEPESLSLIPPTPRPPMVDNELGSPQDEPPAQNVATNDTNSNATSSDLNVGDKRSQPQLAKLQPGAPPSASASASAPASSSAASISHSLTPPTPIDSPSSSVAHGWPIQRTISPDSLSASLSPIPSSSSSPNGGSSRASPSRRGAGQHRRTSSGASRSYRETLNAYAVEDEDGVRSVNQYVLSKDANGPLGKGSYATVERATDRETGIEYAMKEFSKKRLRQIAASEKARRERMAAGGRGRGRGRGRGGRGALMAPPQRISTVDVDDHQGADNLDLVRTEIAIMKKVDHPNIATIHEVIDVTSADALLIVMELCSGGPIMRVEAGNRVEAMPLDEARSVFQQLVLGVAYLHHNHIIHRDIKPDNCLFMADHKHVKLIDFGISKFTAETEDKLDSKGSPAYMPPELLGSSCAESDAKSARHRQDVHGYASDVWSLGVTLYALVTGALPFDDADPTRLFQGIREDAPTYPDALPASLKHLLTGMLNKDPHQRITISDIWEDPWVTDDGKQPLIPYDENCVAFPEPTQAEVDRALNAFRASTFLAMSVVAKLKGKRRKSFSSDSTQSAPRTTSIDEEAVEDGSQHAEPQTFVGSPLSSPLLAAHTPRPGSDDDQLESLDAMGRLPKAVYDEPSKVS